MKLVTKKEIEEIIKESPLYSKAVQDGDVDQIFKRINNPSDNPYNGVGEVYAG